MAKKKLTLPKKKVLIPIGDATEVMDTLYPIFRLPEDGFEAVVCGPEARLYHGVLHEMSAADMAALDKIESAYARISARVRKYDGEVVEATVYSCPRGAGGKPGSAFGAASGKTTQR